MEHTISVIDMDVSAHMEVEGDKGRKGKGKGKSSSTGKPMSSNGVTIEQRKKTEPVFDTAMMQSWMNSISESISSGQEKQSQMLAAQAKKYDEALKDLSQRLDMYDQYDYSGEAGDNIDNPGHQENIETEALREKTHNISDLLDAAGSEKSFCGRERNISVVDEVLDNLKPEETTDPPINERWANAISDILKTKQDPAKAKELREKIKRPDNIPLMRVKRINPVIWEKMNPATRSMDARMQLVGESLVASMAGQARLIDTFTSGERTAKRSLETVVNTMQNIACAVEELNNIRRDLIKPDLNSQYKSLGKHLEKDDSGEWLYGDNLNAHVKALDETAKLSNHVAGRPARRQRNAPYPPMGSYNQGGSWRGRGRPRRIFDNRNRGRGMSKNGQRPPLRGAKHQ